jgi:uncharacterized membrane protein YkoI
MHNQHAWPCKAVRLKSKIQDTLMKRIGYSLLIVLLGSGLTFAAGLISKQAAEKDALAAVGGGTVLQAALDSNAGKRVWSVDIAGSTNEFEVWVDAHTGSILKIITQVQSKAATTTTLLTKQQAEQDALAAVGGGEVLQAALDTVGKNDRKIWSVDILGSAHEYEVWVDAHNGAIVKTITQPLESMAAGCMFLTRAKAEQIALAAVGGGKVLLAVLDKTDTPVDWSVDVKGSNGTDYEVKVNACTGKIITIVIGG